MRRSRNIDVPFERRIVVTGLLPLPPWPYHVPPLIALVVSCLSGAMLEVMRRYATLQLVAQLRLKRLHATTVPPLVLPHIGDPFNTPDPLITLAGHARWW